MDAEIEHLRHDRERFVAFTFCGADMLLELDSAQQVSFAGGAIESLTGFEESDLIGRNLLDLVKPDERLVLHEVMRCVADGQRLSRPNWCALPGPRGPPRR
jgi:PAS domain S-box-containing protein